MDVGAVHDLALVHFRRVGLGVEAMRSRVLPVKSGLWHWLMQQPEHYRWFGCLEFDLLRRGGCRAGAVVSDIIWRLKTSLSVKLANSIPLVGGAAACAVSILKIFLLSNGLEKVATDPTGKHSALVDIEPASPTHEFQPPCPRNICLRTLRRRRY